MPSLRRQPLAANRGRHDANVAGDDAGHSAASHVLACLVTSLRVSCSFPAGQAASAEAASLETTDPIAHIVRILGSVVVSAREFQ